MPDTHRLADLEKRLSIRIEYLPEASSTNDIASLAGREHGDVIWAEHQTKGRGQRGNNWNSEREENLTFSLVLKPVGLPAENQFYLSKIISLGIADALNSLGFASTKIKWPNDIYIEDRKVAGILIENDLLGTQITKSVAGIGLNINQKSFHADLPNPTSLFLHSGNVFDRINVLEAILQQVLFWYDKLSSEEFESIDMAYEHYLYRKSGEHLYREPEGEPFVAFIHSVLSSGELILRRSDGQLRGYLFKEIEFVIKKSE